MKFLLVGHLWYIGPNHIDYNDDINKEIKAIDAEDAIKQAREIIIEALKKEGCPRNCNVACDLYKMSHKIGTDDMWNVMGRKNYVSKNHITAKIAI
ncbi:MAG: hypothetical protein ACYC3G_02765 [Minisyncoccota bacterium]